jgi:hypothetical protein
VNDPATANGQKYKKQQAQGGAYHPLRPRSLSPDHRTVLEKGDDLDATEEQEAEVHGMLISHGYKNILTKPNSAWVLRSR